MKLVALALLCCTAAADAAPLDEVVRAQLAPVLPPDSDVAKIHLPGRLAALDVDPADVAIELPRELRVGRKSIKLTVAGHRPVFVSVSIAALADVAVADRALPAGSVIGAEDVRIETRAAEPGTPALGAAVIGAKVTKPIAANAAIGASHIVLPPPLPRGTQVAVEIVRGRVRVRGTGTLELVARPGEQATVRLAHTKTTLRGTLVAPATVIVKGSP